MSAIGEILSAKPARRPISARSKPLTRPAEKHGVGRPSPYKDVYSQEVVSAGTEGKTLTEFAAEIGVTRQTLYNWQLEYPEFFDACEKHKTKRIAWWESKYRDCAVGGAGNAALLIFATKNADPEMWRDRTESTITINVQLATRIETARRRMEIEGEATEVGE